MIEESLGPPTSLADLAWVRSQELLVGTLGCMLRGCQEAHWVVLGDTLESSADRLKFGKSLCHQQAVPLPYSEDLCVAIVSPPLCPRCPPHVLSGSFTFGFRLG
jgi:hypothetical protein